MIAFIEDFRNLSLMPPAYLHAGACAQSKDRQHRRGCMFS